MTYCHYGTDGVCSACGHATTVRGLIRECGKSTGIPRGLFCHWVDAGHRWLCRECGAAIEKSPGKEPPMASCRAIAVTRTEYLQSSIVPSGPGTELKALLARIGIKAAPNCSCNARARLMDERGVDWCEANLKEIVGWLREEATKRGLPFVDLAGRMLVRKAIRNARKAAAQNLNDQPVA